MSRSRDFEIRYSGNGVYFYINRADAEQRRRLEGLLKRGETVLSLRHFWVAPRLRGTGVGKALLRRLNAATDALGVPVCFYVKPYDNSPLGAEGLRRFYEKAGYKLVQIVKAGDWKGCPFMARGII